MNSYCNVAIALVLRNTKLLPNDPADVYPQQAAVRVIKLHERLVALQKSGRESGTRLVAIESAVPYVRVIPSTYVCGEPQEPPQALASMSGFSESDFGLQDFDMGDLGT